MRIPLFELLGRIYRKPLEVLMSEPKKDEKPKSDPNQPQNCKPCDGSGRDKKSGKICAPCQGSGEKPKPAPQPPEK